MALSAVVTLCIGGGQGIALSQSKRCTKRASREQALPIARHNVLKAGAVMVSTWAGPLTVAQAAGERERWRASSNDNGRHATERGEQGHRRAPRPDCPDRHQSPDYPEPRRSRQLTSVWRRRITSTSMTRRCARRSCSDTATFLPRHRCRRLSGVDGVGAIPAVRPGKHRSPGEDEQPVEAAHRSRARRHLEHGARASPCRRHTHRRRRHALRSRREHARPISRRRRHGPVRTRSRMGERHALYADRRPLER